MDMIRSDFAEDIDSQILNYIDMLEKVNEELIRALKECAGLLSHFKPVVRDPRTWQELVDLIREAVEVGEIRTLERRLH